MATLIELCNRGELIELEGGLGFREQPLRQIYAFPHVIEWLENVLPGIDPDFHEGRLSPLDQADELLHDFIVGADMNFYARCHFMDPGEHGVWELKSPDVRLYGWFIVRDIFVIAEVDSAFRSKKYRLYPMYRDMVRQRRDKIELDEPKFITGGYESVL